MAKLLNIFGLGTPKKSVSDTGSQLDLKTDQDLPKLTTLDLEIARDQVAEGSLSTPKVGSHASTKPRSNSTVSDCSNLTTIHNMNVNRSESLKSVVHARKISRAEEAEMLAYSPSPSAGSPDIRGIKKQPEFHKKAFRKQKIKLPNKIKGITPDKIVVVHDEYSDPADYHLPLRRPPSCTISADSAVVDQPRLSNNHLPVLVTNDLSKSSDDESGLPRVEDDYCEPFEAQPQFHPGVLNCDSTHEEEEIFDEDGAYDEVCETNSDTVVNETFAVGTDSEDSPCGGGPADGRPAEEYDVPWEWGCSKTNRLLPLRCVGGGAGGRSSNASSSQEAASSIRPTSRQSSETGSSSLGGSPEAEVVLGVKPGLLSDDRAVASEEEEEEDASRTMTGRQRHIYETAFDSTVKAPDDDADMELVNHPILTRNEGGGGGVLTTTTTPKSTPGGTPKLVSCRVATDGVQDTDYTPKESRKVTLIRDTLRAARRRVGGGSGSTTMGDSSCSSSTSSPSSSSSTSSSAVRRTEHRVQAIVHLPPRSANSTPTLSSYRAKEGLVDSCASSAKSTPTHFLSSKGHSHHHHHLPVRQFSDLALGENKNTTNLNKTATTSAPMPWTTSSAACGTGRTVGGQCRDGRLPGGGGSAGLSSEESVASSTSTSSSASSSNNNSRGSRGSIDNHRDLKLLATQTTTSSSSTFAEGTVAVSQLKKQFLQDTSGRHQAQVTATGPVGETGIIVDRPPPPASSQSDARPAEEYDVPWDCPKLAKRPPLFADSNGSTVLGFGLQKPQLCRPSSSDVTGSKADRTTDVDRAGSDDAADQSWASKDSSRSSEPCNNARNAAPDFHLALKTESSAPSRSNLSLNLASQSPKRKRNNLQLNFGCSALSAIGDAVDPTIPLERQGWYHGTITRTEAENLLRIKQEGHYLVRNSESSKQDYSLSLKSARGFMHMKIVYTDGKYILGQFSKPFSSIPDMIHHYTRNRLPIKGAEHMSLLHPVIEQLL